MKKLLTFPAGRRAKWVVLGIWLIVVMAIGGGGLPSKLEKAQKNDSSSYLPGTVESSKTLEIVKKLQNGEQAPTVVVYRRDSGLTDEDRSRIRDDIGKLNDAKFENASRFGNPAGGDEPFQVSRDGTTALIANELRATGDSDDILDPITKYRDLVSTGTDAGGDDGLQVKVAGPAGISADAIEIFGGINGTLIATAGGLVLLLLILIYRSPVFWIFPMIAVAFAELTSRGAAYVLTQVGVTVSGQSAGILSVLVLGAGTDYALLLVARYREELRRTEDKHDAMAKALTSAGPAIIASALTVSVALLALTLAKVNGTAGLGPTGAVGILSALLAMMTLLPALLVAVGRRPFWPFIPHVGDEGTDTAHGAWRRLGERIRVRPRRVWIGTAMFLVVLACGLANFSTGLTQSNTFRDEVESIQGQDLIAESFPAGTSAPTQIIVRSPDKIPAVAAAVKKVRNVDAVVPTKQSSEEGTLVTAFLDVDPYSAEAFDLVPDLRKAARSADPRALVGGFSATEYDLRSAANRDSRLLIPLTLVIVLLILVVLLRSIFAPVLLIGTVVLSFAASLGVGAVVFDVIFGFPGSDPSLPLYAFIFLVALGVDYNIFLMARVREETLKHGTRPGMLRGLAVTGGVITSAGIVLAGTFAVLGVLPLTFLTELGFVIAFGVLLDTFLVRSVLVPALVFDIGPKVWWPSALQRQRDDE